MATDVIVSSGNVAEEEKEAGEGKSSMNDCQIEQHLVDLWEQNRWLRYAWINLHLCKKKEKNPYLGPK